MRTLFPAFALAAAIWAWWEADAAHDAALKAQRRAEQAIQSAILANDRAFEAKLAVEASGPRKAFDPGPVCGSAQQ